MDASNDRCLPHDVARCSTGRPVLQRVGSASLLAAGTVLAAALAIAWIWRVPVDAALFGSPHLPL